jgi:hypothetical protein
MNMPRMNVRSKLAAAAAAATLAGGAAAVATASPAAAYGPQQVYQVELSANIPGTNGGGAWLWFGLSSNGTGDYHGSDCGHGGVGAASDGGDVTWQRVGNSVVISGVVLNGLGGFVATVTVPAAFGHYTGTLGSFITVPPFIPSNAGFSQLQVAP